MKKVSQDGAGVVTTYYAGPHYEVRVVAGQDQASLRYRLGDRLVALRLADGRRQYVHGDALGSTLPLTDAAGVERSTGLPVGNARHSKKGIDTMNALAIWLKAHPHGDPNDVAAAENAFRDLADAFSTPHASRRQI